MWFVFRFENDREKGEKKEIIYLNDLYSEDEKNAKFHLSDLHSRFEEQKRQKELIGKKKENQIVIQKYFVNIT
jgi:predicted MPP superfamily phosphohydrolase